MRRQEVDVWISDLVERVARGEKVEDAAVELKREWPTDIRRAARRLAAHANAASGEPILWVFGIDEGAHSVEGVDETETQQWLAQVARCFDSAVAPEVWIDRRLVIEDKPVVGVVFRTDDAPYVVKSGPNEGPIDREVPWRAATGVRSAKRSEILRLLLKKTRALRADVLDVSLAAAGWRRPVGAEHREFLELRLHIQAYVFWKADTPLVLPKHKMRLEGVEELDVDKIIVMLHGRDSGSMIHLESEIVGERSGLAYWSYSVQTRLPVAHRPSPLSLTAVLESDDPDVALRIPLFAEVVGTGQYKAIIRP